MVEYEHTLKLLDDMGLTTAAEQLDAMLDEAARNDEITYLGFLHNLLLQEEEARKRRSLQTRLVSRDGFVSYDGVRYGVPWQYSGKYVTVRAIKDNLEIFDGLMLIASHDIEPHSGRILFLDGQYRGLAEKNGLTFFNGARMHTETVEIRPLSIYEELLEVSNG